MKSGILIPLLLLCSWAQSADKKLSASVFGEIEARCIGPATMSGRITDIDCPNDDPFTIYVGTGGGGVWKSQDAGLNFKSVFDKHEQSIGCITVDQSNSQIIWAGTGEINTRNSVSYGSGLYKSTDGGETWKNMGFQDSERIAEVRVHPTDSDIVYVAVLGHLWSDHKTRGLYKTTDGGKNWEQLLYVDEKTGCIDVDLDPQNPDIVYAAMWQVRRWPYFFESGGPGSGLYKSTDGGKNFRELREGLPAGNLGRIDLDIAPSRPNRVYAIVEGQPEETGLYRSDDLGERWERVSNAFAVKARPFYLSIIKVDPLDFNRVYSMSLQLSVSENGGKAFTSSVSGGGVHSDHQALWINPKDPNHVMVGTDGGLYISRDRSRNFMKVKTLPVSQFYRVTTDDAIPYNVYGGLQDNGSWTGPSAAAGGVLNRHWNKVGGGDGFCTEVDKKYPNYVYWESQGGNLNRLDRDTGENKSIVPYPEKGMEPNRFNWNAPLASSPTRDNVIYFGSQYLFRSENQGDSWTRISPDLTTDNPEKQNQEESGGLTKDQTDAENHCTIFTIAESPLDAQVIWVGTDDGNVQVTRNGGQSWENVTANIPNLPPATWCSSLWPGHHDEGTVFASFDGHRTGDKAPYVYVSKDYGKTWESLVTEDITGHCHVVRQDPINGSLLFLGTENGLFVSLDDGQQWVHFKGGLPRVSIRDMVFQYRENDLVLATHGRGIYIIDDITPLRHLTQDAMSEKVKFLPSAPINPLQLGGSSMSLGSDRFAGTNPSFGAEITYYLSRRHMFGDLYLEIYNEKDELVKTLTGGKRKGINRVSWSMRLKPPKTSGQTLAAGALFGPRAPEGRYRVRLVKGKDSYESFIDVGPGPLNKHSTEDRGFQYQTVMALYRFQEDLSFLSAQIRDLQKQSESLLETAKKGRLKDGLNEKIEALKQFHHTIVSPSDTPFVDQGRLREDIIDLYSGVSSYQGRPSQDQLNQMETLKDRFRKASEEAAGILDVASLNKTLTSKGMKPLVALTRQAWEEENEKDGSGSYTAAFSFLQAMMH